jgi:hypothetical protein
MKIIYFTQGDFMYINTFRRLTRNGINLMQGGAK